MTITKLIENAETLGIDVTTLNLAKKLNGEYRNTIANRNIVEQSITIEEHLIELLEEKLTNIEDAENNNESKAFTFHVENKLIAIASTIDKNDPQYCPKHQYRLCAHGGTFNGQWFFADSYKNLKITAYKIANSKYLEPEIALQNLAKNIWTEHCYSNVSELIDYLMKGDDSFDEFSQIADAILSEDYRENVRDHFWNCSDPDPELSTKGQVLSTEAQELYDDFGLTIADIGTLTNEQAKKIAEAYGIEPTASNDNPLTHFSVSAELYTHLKKHGEQCFKLFSMYIWQRETTGQSVYIDHVIQQIAESWENKQ